MLLLLCLLFYHTFHLHCTARRAVDGTLAVLLFIPKIYVKKNESSQAQLPCTSAVLNHRNEASILGLVCFTKAVDRLNRCQARLMLG